MNNLLEYKGYAGTVEYSDGVLHGKVLGIRSLISYEGDSVAELRQDFQGAVDDYLDLCEEKGIEPEKTYRGTFNVRISPESHRRLAVYSAQHHQSFNASVEEAIEKLIYT